MIALFLIPLSLFIAGSVNSHDSYFSEDTRKGVVAVIAIFLFILAVYTLFFS